MRRPVTLFVLLLTLPFLFGTAACSDDNNTSASIPTHTIEVGEMTVKLPEAKYDSHVSLEQSLVKRRSIREYTDAPLTLEDVSQLLWSAQGITSNWGGRTAPSAGALYPLELYVVVGNVHNLANGIYRYSPNTHEIVLVTEGDKRSNLANAALGQASIADGAIDLVFTAVYQRTTHKYHDRGIQYVLMEIGHAAQNVCLQATAMGLGAVTIGAFYDEQVKKVMNLQKDEEPLYIIPVGKY